MAKPLAIAGSGVAERSVRHADCGIAVARGDAGGLAAAVADLWGLDADARIACGMRGREWVLSHGTWMHAARQYADFAAEVIGLQRSAGSPSLGQETNVGRRERAQ